MEDYFKGYICVECIGSALKAHQTIIEDKMSEARKENEI
jgi:hypothetical protein